MKTVETGQVNRDLKEPFNTAIVGGHEGQEDQKRALVSGSLLSHSPAY